MAVTVGTTDDDEGDTAIIGTEGTFESDTLFGLVGFDWLIPTLGDDVLDGGADGDVAIYSWFEIFTNVSVLAVIAFGSVQAATVSLDLVTTSLGSNGQEQAMINDAGDVAVQVRNGSGPEQNFSLIEVVDAEGNSAARSQTTSGRVNLSRSSQTNIGQFAPLFSTGTQQNTNELSRTEADWTWTVLAPANLNAALCLDVLEIGEPKINDSGEMCPHGKWHENRSIDSSEEE